MGLDMYLQRKRYVKNWDHNPSEKFFSGIAFQGNKPINLEKINSITFDVMDWRKTNWIHNWFVQMVQGGLDDCKEYFVEIEQLEDLLDTIDQILRVLDSETLEKAQKVAEEKLPAVQGFFFGPQDYDDWYFDSLRETSYNLKKELSLYPDDDYYYNASW
jgi:hypothetical protein